MNTHQSDDMVIAGTIRLDDLLAGLAHARPVFHSEADLQHALAWQVHLLDPHVQVRLEVRPDPAVREVLDLLVHRPDHGRSTAIEVKYWKKRWSGTAAGERFDLPNQGAHDIRRYDFVKDISRVERFVAARPGCDGLVLLWSNDDLDWRPPATFRATAADAFRIHEGATLDGERAWSAQAGAGTTKGREKPIALTGHYRMAWRDFTTLDHVVGGRMRLLAVKVEKIAQGMTDRHG
ncbi:hypothetical protein [Saccharothrix sp.]|uniref:hypothetical protein n=1 Tax=Saccharothrix sp. TaxID=1873460 RepID=UPI0028118B54|nr:hypothetical protein [Saccharothrix sp.]